jgi:uncharacterized protein YcaQ
MARRKISLNAARKIALAAQGFDRPRPGAEVNAGHIRRVIEHLGLLQLDFVNVLVPAHLLVLFSRLGPFRHHRFHRSVYGSGNFTEQWAHEASIVPIELWPVLEHRREDYRPYPNSPIMKLKGKSSYLKQVIEIVSEKGPVTSQDLPWFEGPKRRPGDWHRSVPRWALEYHFGSGGVAVTHRQTNFQRVYDIPERVIDEDHRARSVSRRAAQRELLRRAAQRCGVGTLQDLADYYRMSPREAAPRIDELVAGGELLEVTVEGWQATAYLSPDARCPRRISAARILSPFDPLVWFRPRTERLFDFHYRIEIYVPEAKRKWGYYVLPFLLDDRIVARVDLKADRRNGDLLVLASHPEEGIDVDKTAAGLAGELRLLADWLGLDRVRVSRRGRFARPLSSAVRDSA